MGEDLPQKFGQYTLHELIARGGMAEIYRATMPGIGDFEKTVAIKKILPHLAEDDEFITMLVDEARIIESLDHSNIAQVYDLGKLEGSYYIAMEYIHGVDIADIVEELDERGERMPIPHVTYITSSICAGLHFAHSKTDENGEPLNIVHRDISLHNVLLSFAGEVKIIDFGVAKAAGREARTKMGVIKGKLLYMAPEQAKAEDLDGRADLFATGLCTYKMLTGELPFEGENEFQVYNNILSKDIVPPKEIRPEVPEELDRIVMKLLRRDRDERYQDGYAVKQDLDRLLHEVAPGYTANRLSTFVQDNFSHLVQTDDPEEVTTQSEPGNMAPSTPANQSPRTGNHDTDQLEETDASASVEPVREGVPADDQAQGARTGSQGSEAEVTSSPSEGPRPKRTEMEEGKTGEFESSPSAAESDDDDGPRPIVFAIGALLLVIGGLVGYAMLGDGPAGNGGDGGGGDSDETSPAITSVDVAIGSRPDGARVVRQGQVVGTTPLELALPRTQTPIELTLRKSGYDTKTIEVVPDQKIDRTVELPAASGSMDAGTDAVGDAEETGDTARADVDSDTSTDGGDTTGGDGERPADDEENDERTDDESSGERTGAPDRDRGGRERETEPSESAETSADDSSDSADDEELLAPSDDDKDEEPSGSPEEADSESSEESGDSIKVFGDEGTDDSEGSADEGASDNQDDSEGGGLKNPF